MDSWIINEENFSPEKIKTRIEQCPDGEKKFLQSALNYLYGSTRTIDKERVNMSLKHLSNAEKKVIKWLFARTNGSLRKDYGANALLAAKNAKYKCSNCPFDDVRALELDHVEGKRSKALVTNFACLCANCHNIKSFKQDWFSNPPKSI